jgi:hypothetical protein
MRTVPRRRLSLLSVLLSALFGVLVTSLVPSLTLPVSAIGLPPHTSHFVAVPKARLADTRAATHFGYALADPRTFRVPAGGVRGIPSNATAVVVNITALASKGRGVVSAYPSGITPPVDSKLPPIIVFTGAGQTRTNLVTVKLGTIGTVGAFDVRRTVGTDLLIDVVGAYTPVLGDTRDGRFVALTGQRRVLTGATIAARSSVPVDLARGGVPAGATAALITITAARGPKGYLTAYAEGVTRPSVFDISTDTNQQTRTNQTIVPLNGINSLIRLYSAAGGAANVDVVGYYTGVGATASAQGLFLPMSPLRRLDTRTNRPLAPFGPVTFEFPLVNPHYDVQGFVANLTTSESWDAGVVGTRPAGTSLTGMTAARIFAPRETATTHFTGRASSRGVAIGADKGAHLVVDIEGVFLGTRPIATSLPVKNRVFAATGVVAVRWTDAAGTHVKPVEASRTNTSNDMTRIADKSIAAAFKNMETLGRKGNTMLFGHRTTHGGIFRSLNTIRVGATFSLKGADGHWYNYRVTRVGVTTPVFANIASMATPYPPVTAQLIACSRRDGTPTSLSYRIVVTGILVGVN